jgi:hypothetical protein
MIARTVVRIIELVSPERSRFRSEFAYSVEGRLNELRRNFSVYARNEFDGRTERAHCLKFLFREGIGRYEVGAIAFGRTHHSQRTAGAAACIVYDSAFWLKVSPAFGSLDHRQGHAIFQAARGICALPLHEDRSPPWWRESSDQSGC